jgi:hypothetical protein
MRPTFAIATAILSSLASVLPRRPIPLRLPRQPVTLLGNADRCGVPTKRVGHAGKVIHDLIGAASYDRTEEAAADLRFVEIFMASAFPDRETSLIPPCAAVVAQFERLEQHHRQSGMN